jgi:hypothetical protein
LRRPAPGLNIPATFGINDCGYRWPEVLRRTVLHSSPLVEVATVSCDAVRSESAEPETATTFALVLVRRGCFYRRINGDSPLLDATSAYLQHPDDEQIINHPCDGGDVCTVITLSPEIIPDEASEARAGFARIPTLRVVDALHRQLLARVVVLSTSPSFSTRRSGLQTSSSKGKPSARRHDPERVQHPGGNAASPTTLARSSTEPQRPL